MNPVLLNNRYRILQELGMGGFGQTFLAEDTQMPSKRRCVIKQLKPVTGNPAIYQMVQERFAREAAVLEQLGDGNAQIPKLFAYFELEGQFYLVQEWIEGGTLTKKVQTLGTLSEAQVRSLLTKILPVLTYVHSFRIVHRDIKPDNIMLRPSNPGSFSPGEDVPFLIDFGAVKETMATAMSSSGGVTNSIAIGSPGFMSAEQAAGRPLYSSDLYSLGLTAIYMLTGKIPQEFPTDPATGEILWRSYAPTVSPGLGMVLDRAIRFNPCDRFPTAQEMLDALKPDVNSQVATVPIAPANRAAVPPSQVATVPIAPANRAAVPPSSPSPYRQSSPRPSGISPRAVGVAAAVLAVSFLIGFGIAQDKMSSDSPIATPPTNNPSSDSPPPTPTPPTDSQPTTPEPPPVVIPPSEPEPPPVVIPPSEPETPVDVIPPAEPEPPVDVIPPAEPETPVDVIPPAEPELPDSTPEPTEPVGDRPTPEESVIDYYANINDRNYSQSWNQLDTRFQTNQSGDYNTYTEWWNSVRRVTVNNVNVVASTPFSAIVDTSLTYIMEEDSRVSNETLRMSLIWDEETGTWAIEQTSRL
ncbi:protein kinase domain-containing protein [Oscillatoria acuminata]|uniref:non-specific serine/threonine protein kinase n=1 Tax=Oscillatoria acuminata PCC 6304 TaxID=56110 RepID=K9TCV9_9CYAN|nr:protein kinase [Oscillatoria acuminata]AFY79971.1 serine/threonine protein kinase [Oscillatoria acuminata PCC 6304]